MGNIKEDKIPKDREEARKFYGDDHNNQRKDEDLDKIKDNNQVDENDKNDKSNRTKSNVLTHPKDKHDESFEVKHNENNSKEE